MEFLNYVNEVMYERRNEKNDFRTRIRKMMAHIGEVNTTSFSPKTNTMQVDLTPEQEVSNTKLYKVMHLYTQWNSYFSSNVVRLSSYIHEYFTNHKMNVIGAQIASSIYSSAIHEYVEEINGCKYTHAELSDIFIRMLKMGLKQSDDVKLPNSCVDYKYVKHGYLGMNVRPTDKNNFSSINEICRAIGYHIASEGLAAFEFQELDYCFQTKKLKPIYDFLQNPYKPSGVENHIKPYHWLKIHGVVEIEHFNDALKAYHLLKGIEDDGVELPEQEFINGYKRFLNTQNMVLSQMEEIIYCKCDQN